MDFEESVPVTAEVTAETDIIAVGGHVSARSLVMGYSQGIFPMDIDADIGNDDLVKLTAWFAPAERAVLRYPGMHVSRSLRKAMRGFRITVNSDFAGVVGGCADPTRPHGWINADYAAAYQELHTLGLAHSVEVWHHHALVGGLLGVQLGGLFCADSKFHRMANASKVAVAALSANVFGGENAHDRVIDAQWLTPHLASLGFVAVPRDTYEGWLPGLLALPPAVGTPGSRTR